MEFLNIFVKSLFILASIVVMALPFLFGAIAFKLDSAGKVSFRRFGVFLFSVIYVVAITIVLFLFKELNLWFESLDFVKWLSSKFAFDGRVTYFIGVMSAIIINIAIGLVFLLLARLLGAFIKRKGLNEPDKDGKFSLGQRIERAVIRFFHNETWFLVARILKRFNLLLSLVYALVFVFYQLPAYFGAEWIPYDFILSVFDAGYNYPVLTLLPLWEAYFLLAGIQRIDEECPELLTDDAMAFRRGSVDIAAIDEEVHKLFGDFYSCDVKLSGEVVGDVAASSHTDVTNLIARAVENDVRNPHAKKEIYLNCLDQLVGDGRSVLINGSFFGEFSVYFLRYLSVILARGDNVIFVCNSEAEINSTYDYVEQGLAEMSSLYCAGASGEINFDDTVWKMIKISGEDSNINDFSVDEKSILVTSLDYICSNRFESEYGKFVHLLDTIVFVDVLTTLNNQNRQLAVLNTRLKNMTRTSAMLAKNGESNPDFKVRYMSRDVRYICFGDTRVPEIDRVLKNVLAVDFVSSDIMRYSASTVLRCYNYEGRPDAQGRRICPQVINSKEELGAIVNMALVCLSKGAGAVNIFVDDSIPYESISETVAANAGRLVIKADGRNIKINKYNYNPDDYTVIIAMDTKDNLPAAVRRYAAMVSDKPALIMIFSRPYMLREYYVSRIADIWGTSQISRIPVVESADVDIAYKILAKANAGGVSREEILSYASASKSFDAYAKNKDVDGVLRKVLEICGERSQRIRLFDFFEYVSSKNFDEDGMCVAEDRVVLRRQGDLFNIISGRNSVTLVVNDELHALDVPKDRLTHNFIAGQNLLYCGNVYYIKSVDTSGGRLHARLAVGGNNDEAYSYLQEREYRIEPNSALAEPAFRTRHLSVNRIESGVKVADVRISAFRTPAEVITTGYRSLDPHTMSCDIGKPVYQRINTPGDDSLARQTYRKYGNFTSPTYTFERSASDVAPVYRENGALVMHISISGSFGDDARRTSVLAASMLNELIHAMFPSVKDAVVVCPVCSTPFEDEESKTVLAKEPRLTVVGENDMLPTRDVDLVIIEDSDSDLGVISVLLSSGNDVLKTLFEPIYEYLTWSIDAPNEDKYYYRGLDHEPACFDVQSLKALASIVGDDKHDTEYVNMEDMIEYEVCDFCGKRYVKGEDIVELEDGRRMCTECANSLVGNNKKELKLHLERARDFLESCYGISLEDDYEFCFDSTVKIANMLRRSKDILRRGTDIPARSYVEDKKVHVEYSLPSVNLSEILVRELTHIWQIKNVPKISEELAEGQIALVAIQYLRYLNQHSLANVRTNYYESSSGISGEGYRRLVRELLANRRYKNNPFIYLLEAYGAEGVVIPPAPQPQKIEFLGEPYTPSSPDRVLGGKPEYFWRSRLYADMQEKYDKVLAAIENFEESVYVGCDKDEAVTLFEAVTFDHPELFACTNTYGVGGGGIAFNYGVTREEADRIRARINAAVASYTEGITDEMSAYDVAIRLYAKLVNTVEYDHEALAKEEAENGPAPDKIDYLRSFCGVFLNGKAVCEGYARALQYLLQLCGVESAEAAGMTKSTPGNPGGGHAWIIIKIDGDYYYCDPTWDDRETGVQTIRNLGGKLDYYCITTEELLRTRDLSMCPVAPATFSAKKANYFNHNDLLLENYDVEKMKEIAVRMLGKGERSFFVKLGSEEAFNTAKINLVDGANDDVSDIARAVRKADKSVTSVKCKACSYSIYTLIVDIK